MIIDGLLEEKAPWPPPGHVQRIRQAQKYGKLFDGDAESLRSWIREVRARDMDIKEFITYPIPEIVARTLATFLFGEDIEIKSETQQDAVEELEDETKLHRLNQEAAVTCCIEGEIYYKIDWDEDVSNRAIISAVPGGLAVPVFKFGRLIEVMFYEELQPDEKGETIFRHIEARGRGVIRHLLFRGDKDKLGQKLALTESSLTDGYVDEIETDIEDLLVRHVPWWRTARSPHGRSVLKAKDGLIGGLYALYSQDQHDAEMAKRRIAMSEEYAKKDSKGRPVFDRDTDVMLMDQAAAGALGDANKPIHPIEFTDSTVMGQRIAQRIDELLLACGIAPQSAGRDVAGTAESGTARKLAQALTLQTCASAGRYFGPALRDVIELAAEVTRKHLDEEFPLVEDASVEMSDGFVDDLTEQAQRINVLRTAQVMSIKTAIVEIHPDWDDAEVDAEVQALIEEHGVNLPDLFEGGKVPPIPASSEDPGV